MKKKQNNRMYYLDLGIKLILALIFVLIFAALAKFIFEDPMSLPEAWLLIIGVLIVLNQWSILEEIKKCY